MEFYCWSGFLYVMEIIFLFTFVKTAEILPTRNTAPMLFVLMFLFFAFL
ncbi:hypothetical protein EfmE980_0547 [Enterococcus faecium E980]|nr:hypothetical protein EfmE980_0547 [Enterococcus faecium E980]